MATITTESEQKKRLLRKYAVRLVAAHGQAILCSRSMQAEKQFFQHGRISCYDHSVAVAYFSLLLAKKLHLRIDEKSLIRGALLHDYFLYDWHIPHPGRRLHGLHHAKLALQNAERDYTLNAKERDIIVRHMFPLNPIPPRCRESVLVTAADKFCAVCEAFSAGFPAAAVHEIKHRCFCTKKRLTN